LVVVGNGSIINLVLAESPSIIRERYVKLSITGCGESLDAQEVPAHALLARAHDPPPGNTVVWRSMSRLTDIELGILIGVGLMGN
jgi:hypothetical protein